MDPDVDYKRQCNKCGGTRERGYISNPHTGPKTDLWVKGSARRPFWDVFLMKSVTYYPTRAYRCSSCGHLEFYALPEEDASTA